MPLRRDKGGLARLPELRAKANCRWACAAGTSAVATRTASDRATGRIFMREPVSGLKVAFPSSL